MLRQCRRNTRGQIPEPALVQGNAAYLPFADDTFDGLFHFGGLNLFGDHRRALKEFSRVVKPGGWIAYGDEKMSATWEQRNPLRARILKLVNLGFKTAPPSHTGWFLQSEHEVMGGLGYLRVGAA